MLYKFTLVIININGRQPAYEKEKREVFQFSSFTYSSNQQMPLKSVQ